MLNIYIVDHHSIYSLNNHTFLLTVEKIRTNNSQTIIEFKGKEKLIAYYQNEFNYQIGDKLEIEGNLEEPLNNTIPNLFNYKEYLYHNNIYYLLNINKIKLVKRNTNIIYKIKNYLIKRINKIDQNKEYLYAFILGENYYIDKDLKEEYQFNGVSHLLAIGSMNITLITMLLTYLLKKFGVNDYIYLIIIIFVITIYIILTDLSVSIIRCGILFILSFINKKYKLEIKYKYLLMMVMSISLLIKPFYIYNLGFIYSYIVSLSLVIFNNLLKGNYLISLIKISFIAYLISMPINIYYNYEINFLSIILNIFYVPYMNFIIFPLSILVILVPKLNVLLTITVDILETITNYSSNIKLFSIILSKPNIYLIIIYYLFIIIFIKSINKKQYYKIIPLILLIIIHFNKDYFIKEDYLLMLDVKQGDSLILKMNNEIYLIDSGGNYYNDYSSKILSYLKSIGERKIDNLIITHGDFDHIGSSYNIVNNYKVEQVIFNCGPHNDLEKKLIEVLKKKNIKYYSCINNLSNKLHFLQTKEYNNENDNSNVIYTSINDYKILLMGDASSTTEKEIMKKYKLNKVDILKVGHHGSRTSSSKDFIDLIDPNYSLISVGNNNRYGHPNKEVLDNLTNSKIYRTDLDGSIMIKIKNNGIKIDTCEP